MPLNGLAEVCEKGGGSWLVVEYLPLEGVDSFLAVMTQQVGGQEYIVPPDLKAGYAWLKLPSIQAAQSITENGTDTKQGLQLPKKLTATLPPITPAMELELETTRLVRFFLVRFKDKKGSAWLMGDMDNPCEFDYDYDTTKVKAFFTCKSGQALRPLQAF